MSDNKVLRRKKAMKKLQDNTNDSDNSSDQFAREVEQSQVDKVFYNFDEGFKNMYEQTPFEPKELQYKLELDKMKKVWIIFLFIGTTMFITAILYSVGI